MATTPPAPTTFVMPSTPRHGVLYDIDARESPLRRSARLLNRKILRDTTPMESNAPRLGCLDRSSVPEDDKTHCSSHAHSPISSIPTSPNRNTFIRSSTQKMNSHDTAKRPPSTLHNARHKSSTDVSDNLQSSSNLLLTQTTLTASMLPTPAKTPRKKNVTSNTGSTARVLFPPRATDTEMPPPKRMKSIGLDDLIPPSSRSKRQKTIDFFVDSRDQIPDVNQSEDNPFIVHSDDEEEEDVEEQYPASPCRKPQHNTSKSEKASSSRDPAVVKSVHREDGMLYTFRGKKIFRKFDDDEDEDEEEDDDELLLALSGELDEDFANFKPLTRSSIKPKVLFPTNKKKKQETTTHKPALRTPSPEPDALQGPETPVHDAEPVEETPSSQDAEPISIPTPEIEPLLEERVDNDVPKEEAAPMTPIPATPSTQTPAAPPQTPRTLRPRGIKAYLNPIASTKKPKPTKDGTKEPAKHAPEQSTQDEPSTPPARTLRSRVVEGSEAKPQETRSASASSTKKGRSPFDSWRRTKSSAPASPMLSKLRKRTAASVPLEPVGDSSAQKKARSK
ncbi:hypothetical protein KEM56_006082 [Ascosphaera pollenicola]|nr:hypothetical protein KEM56_006082 [Ascosphaera pollenicola]